jgi:hypothetical protein
LFGRNRSINIHDILMSLGHSFRQVGLHQHPSVSFEQVSTT